MPYICGLHHPAAADGGRGPTWSSCRRKASWGAARSPSTPATAPWSARWSRPSASPSVSRARPRRGAAVVLNPGWCFRLLTMLTLTTGTAFIMWLGEQITERGIGNGISLIIFAGIVAGMPHGRRQHRTSWSRTGELNLVVIILLILLVVGVIAVIIFFERGQRRIPVQYAKRVVGPARSTAAVDPLPAAASTPPGVILPIFASSILLVPGVRSAGFTRRACAAAIGRSLQPRHWRYNSIYVGLIIFFCYFYTAVTFNPIGRRRQHEEVGRLHPGHPAGQASTAEYIDQRAQPDHLRRRSLRRRRCACCRRSCQDRSMSVPFYFGGTGPPHRRRRRARH